MKRNTLYTANSFNQRLFYSEGGDMPVDEKKPATREKKKHTGKLVTVNKWNMPAFAVDRENNNIFDALTPGQSQQINNSSSTSTNPQNPKLSTPTVTPYIDWSNPTDRAKAMGQVGAMVQNSSYNTSQIAGSMGTAREPQFVGLAPGISTQASDIGGKSGGGFNMGSALQAGAGVGLNMLDTIKTGDKRGLWDTLDPVYHLAGGRESAAGNVMSDVGVSLTKAGLQSGQPYMAIAGAALKVVGGLTNAAFGIKTDQRKLNAMNESIEAYNNFKSNASSFDDIKGVTAAESGKVYEGGWFSGGAADEKNEELNRRMNIARSFADRSVSNNISNIIDDQLSNALANYSAFGGYLTRPKKKRKIKR